VSSLCTPAYRQAGLCNSFTTKNTKKITKNTKQRIDLPAEVSVAEMKLQNCIKVKIAPQ